MAAVTMSTSLAFPMMAGATDQPSERILITQSSCAPTWTAPRTGQDTFVVENRTERSGAVYLFNPYTGITVDKESTLPPESSLTLHVDVKPGHYTWGCHLRGEGTHQSADVTVRQPPVMTAAGPTTRIPVAPAQLVGPVLSYQTYVSQQLNVLVGEVTGLQSAIANGNLAQAEAAWLTAHLTWQRVGAAYDAFGTLGTSINGLAPGQDVGQTPGMPGDSSFEGFHRIELDLWGEQNLAAAGADAVQLAGNVARLVTQFSTESIPPAELPLRTHEILEDSLRDELSGDDDYGSGTDMASVEADVSGTEVLLHLLAPLLKERAPDLVSRAMVQLDRLDVALSATMQDGRWVAVSHVPLSQREQVDGAIGAVLEILAVIPDVMPVVGSTL
jgi:high-affinity iron transporter